MYIKLMTRSLLRHQKRGRRLFVLMALCSAALVFLLTFRTDFQKQTEKQLIGLESGHLQILPPDSPALAETLLFTETERVPLLDIPAELDSWLLEQAEVAGASPILARNGLTYNLDSEQESWLSLIGVDPQRFLSVYPLARAIEGSDDIAWKEGQDVPVLRARIDGIFGYWNPDPYNFHRYEIRTPDDSLPVFMNGLARDFPDVFTGSPYDSAEDWKRFSADWSVLLNNPDRAGWLETIPAHFFDEYDWRLDDALWNLRENGNTDMDSFFKKRVFQALYPDEITELWEPIRIGKRLTAQLAPMRTSGAITLPVSIPVRYAGYCDIIPLYTPNSFIDIAALRSFLDVDEHFCTAYVIRLRDGTDITAFRARLEQRLIDLGMDARIADWRHLGKIQLTTAFAFSAVISILVGMFVIIVMIFTVNLVLISMVQRKREIGTGLAMGLGNGQTILLMSGEVGVIVTVSCIAGTLFSILLIGLAARFGVPGMIFFASKRLHLTWQLLPFAASFILLVPSSMLVSLVPLSRLNRSMPVDFFREDR